MATREEVLLDELYVHLIDLAYHWEPGIYHNYQYDTVHVVPCENDTAKACTTTHRAQQNKALMSLQLLVTLDQKAYSLEGKNKDMLRRAKEYVRKFDELYAINHSAWDDTFLSRLAQVLKNIIEENADV